MTVFNNSTPGRTPLQTMARVVFWVLATIITALALYPRLTLPEPAVTEGTTAYYNHVFAFTTLIVVGAIGWGLRRRLVGGVAVGAIALELAQTLSPGRETSLVDLLASLGGVALGCAVAYVAGLALRRIDVSATPAGPKI